MKKIKKWQIIVFIILSIGGYWLIQNTWIFEKKIPKENYESFITGTKWFTSERDSFWYFNSNNEFLEEINDKNRNIGIWKIEDSIIVLNYKTVGTPVSFNIEHKYKIVDYRVDRLHLLHITGLNDEIILKK